MINQPENVPLQGGNMYYPNKGQPSSVVQHTTVNITREMPKDHFIWSLLCFLYSNPCCLGLAALIHSVKARDRKVLGDIEGARAYGSTARTLNIISTVISCLMVLIVIIVIAVLSAKASQVVHSISTSYDRNNYNYNYNGRYYSG